MTFFPLESDVCMIVLALLNCPLWQRLLSVCLRLRLHLCDELQAQGVAVTSLLNSTDYKTEV